MASSEKVTIGAISPEQARAARGLLDWSRDHLAEKTGVAKRTLVRFEAAEGETRPSTLAAIRTALETAGVVFIPENGGGAGVRLRKAEEGEKPARDEEATR
jgi:transcriptional regulator with XRE-family HTH domain